MKLPNSSAAIVATGKIVDYLLNPEHPDNGGKAAFFVSLGFSREEWQVLDTALRKHAEALDVRFHLESPHGEKYILEGPIESPSERQSTVRTIWIVDKGQITPRLVTAYPCGPRG